MDCTPLTAPVSVRGEVIRGAALGRTLGFPTANIRPQTHDPLPSFGVYAGWALGHPAAVSIGVRPTVGAWLEPLVEAYLLDFEGDLYGQDLTVEIIARLRDEERFESLDSLRAQIEVDVAAVRAILDPHSQQPAVL